MEKIVVANDQSLGELIAEGKVIVDFWADWCGPCKRMLPIIEELALEEEDITFIKVNVDENQESAGKYGVMSIPTFLVFKDGVKVGLINGAMPKSMFKEQYDKAFG